jgi:hypothetical protein
MTDILSDRAQYEQIIAMVEKLIYVGRNLVAEDAPGFPAALKFRLALPRPVI